MEQSLDLSIADCRAALALKSNNYTKAHLRLADALCQRGRY
jgi:hypothetical protein